MCRLRASTMAEFTGGDDYQAEFDPKAYLGYFKFGEDTLGEEYLNFLLSACESFKEIILEAFDWTPVVKYVCELEGNRYRGWKKQIVLKCDVHKSNPLDPIVLPPADGLVSSLCLEAACKDLTTYRIALKNISSLLKHLVLSGDLSCSFYMVGPKRFSCLVLKEEFLREALSETGFIIQEFEVLVRDDNIDDSSDFSGKVFILARKEEAI
uniref:Uncharacterized protein n=1 Tax=Chrysemys picta bellii TaxID=8478 RepID=A0A8C3P8Q8_CHRPI